MRSLVLMMPIVMLILSVVITGLFIYAFLSLARSNRRQAESLREIEKILKQKSNKEKSFRSE